MPYMQPSPPRTQSDSRSAATTYNSFFSQPALPSFLVDQAVEDILQELIVGRLPDRVAKYFVKNCLKNITPGDKEFLALFRWRIEAVPLRGKPLVPILPHIVSPELRSAIISDLVHYRSWGLSNDVELKRFGDGWSDNANLVFQRLRGTVCLMADYLGTEIHTWDD